jgi:hypothetical protein
MSRFLPIHWTLANGVGMPSCQPQLGGGGVDWCAHTPEDDGARGAPLA